MDFIVIFCDQVKASLTSYIGRSVHSNARVMMDVFMRSQFACRTTIQGNSDKAINYLESILNNLQDFTLVISVASQLFGNSVLHPERGEVSEIILRMLGSSITKVIDSLSLFSLIFWLLVFPFFCHFFIMHWV